MTELPETTKLIFTEEEARPAHSLLGASGAERWMNCPGSVELLSKLELPTTDEPDYRTEGTATHEAAAFCLQNDLEAWEAIGERFNGLEFTAEMSEAVQVYLDEVRPLMAGADQVFIEQHIEAPEVHKQYYGTVDFAAVHGRKLACRDYKNGAGVVVEVENNPQLKYYAWGICRICPAVEEIELGIVQPNAFHPEGPVRTWTLTRAELQAWIENELKPAMVRATMERSFDAGKWCRFCPAKLVCPLLVNLWGSVMQADPRALKHMTPDRLGDEYQYKEAALQYLKALEEETFRRLNQGEAVRGTKLVGKKANRVMKPEAEPVFKGRFGAKAYTEPQLKSPAEMERLGPEAKQLVKEYAFTPFTGLTVALERDKRVAVKVQSAGEVFGGAVANLGGIDGEVSE